MWLLPQKIVGIDFHDHSAEVVQLKRYKGNFFLEAYNRVIIPNNVLRDGEIKDEDQLKSLLSNFLLTSNPKAVDIKNVAILLPSSKIFTHLFAFPATLSPEEISKTIAYDAETVIPFAIQDVYWDFSILKKDDHSQKHASQYVLFAAVTKKALDQYTRVLEEIGLHPFLFGVHTEALACNFSRAATAPSKPTLIINFGTLSTHYLVMKEGRILYFFTSNEGGSKLIRRLAKTFDVSENSIMEVREKTGRMDDRFEPLVKKFFEKKYGRAKTIIKMHEANSEIGPINEIILTGEFLNLPHFFELAKFYFPNHQIGIGDPKMDLQIDASKFLPLHKKKGGPVPYSTYFTNSIGIALLGLQKRGRGTINLLPDSLKQNLSYRKNSLYMIVGSILMVIFSLFWATFFFFQHQNLAYERLRLEAQKSSVEKKLYGTRYQETRERINAFNEEVRTLHLIDSNLFSVPRTLDMLLASIPSGVTVSALEFRDSELSIEITGIAESRDSLLKFEQNLKMTPFVQEVVAPLSNYDEKYKISFLLDIKLDFIQLPTYDTDPPQ